ncbi:PBAN-type neuropeptides-like [Topomyia yanbarensis]|uniref:PBAN-type neuropeptides-like n=1 Tax=Topomyia yanbarensis TaxID=2498891 RepID=UPI00273CD7E7|nr:PBAN-type neuropeptides-like [Topomyia yanbarensis]
MFKFYIFFNVVCIYLAIRSALGAEVPDPNEQKMSSYFAADNHDEDAVGKRGSAMWFGPRLGKRTIPLELHDELQDEMDSSPLFYSGESPHRLATEISQGTPYVVLLVTGRAMKSQPVYYSATTPRLGRRAAPVNENHSRPPFAPRLGRNLPISPRLGRSFSGAEDSFGY